MRNCYHFICFWLLVLNIQSCTDPIDEPKTISQKEIQAYIQKGWKIYGEKNNTESFTESILYFDTALELSKALKDSIQIGNAYFAKGAVYDAWNQDKDKTIEYFKASYHILSQVPHSNPVKRIYIHHLIAHAYEKKGDSMQAIEYINETLNLFKKQPDSIQSQCDFIVQLALIASKVSDYKLAENIITRECNRAGIKNDSLSYYYLDNYYLTRARIDIYAKKKSNSPYLDSFYEAYCHIRTSVDSFEMLEELYPMYKRTSQIDRAYSTLYSYTNLYKRINSIESHLRAQKTLYDTEVALKKTETHSLRKTNLIYSLCLILLFLILGGGFLYIKKTLKEKEKLKSLLDNNERLRKNVEHQNQLNLILNKEIHHRIKNNLQLIYSLFDMNERYVENEEAKGIIREGKNRIRSISYIFELMKSNLVNVHSKDFFKELIHLIINNFTKHQAVNTNLSIGNFEITHKQYAPISIILNELLTNSLKHSDPNTPLTIYFEAEANHQTFVLTYYDSIPAPIEHPTNKGMGLDLIDLLIIQLKGTLERSADNYFQYKICIPYDRSQ